MNECSREWGVADLLHPGDDLLTNPMNFRIQGHLAYESQGPATIIASLHGMQTLGQQVYRENFQLSREALFEIFAAGFGQNRFARIRLDSGGPISLDYSAEVMTSTIRVPQTQLLNVGPGQISPDVIPYLFPSRYCQSDMLREQAQNLFGNIDTPYHMAEAVADWVSKQISYVSGSTNEQTSAVDVMNQREGVCRDFAHLGIALCRALTIPARYTTVYAYQLEPQDFHACFEANIGGRWFIFDATNLAPLNGLIRISTGRDASDTAVASLFGDIKGTGISVSCENLDENFEPITRDGLQAANEALILQ